MKLTNYDGTEASVEAYAIWNNVLILREETLPWLKENPNNFEEDARLERIKAIKGYERKLLHDLGVELGNDKAWENV